MQGLTPDGQRIVADIASRHGFSTESAEALLSALAAGNGTQAQFNHPEFGGMGQWSQGGMIMIGDMFNNNLKARVDALCRDLAGALAGDQMFAAARQDAGSWQSQRQNYQGQNYNVSGAAVSLFAQGFGQPRRNWWPAGLGSPTSLGSQNDMRYAYFPSSNRLAIQEDGRVSVYDSGEHHISGVSQQQGGGQSLTFTSQFGTVRLGDLKLVSQASDEAPQSEAPAASGPAESAPPQQAPAQPVPAAPSTFAPSESAQSIFAQSSAAPPPNAGQATDIFATIERLAELRQKNILSEDEFAAKKAELLARL